MTSSSPPAGRPSRPWPWLAVVFLAGLGAGWVIHRPTEADAGKVSGTTTSPVVTSRPDRPRADEAGAWTLPPATSPAFADSVRNLMRDTDDKRRLIALNRLLEHATPAHLAALVDFLKEDEAAGNRDSAEWSALWSYWGKTDGPGVLRYLKEQGSQVPPMSDAQDGAMTAWAQADASAAIRFLENDENFRQGDQTLLPGLVRGLCARGDLDAALDMLGRNATGGQEEYGLILDAARRQGGATGEDALFDRLAADASKANEASGVAQALLNSRQNQDPVKTAQWVDAHQGAAWQPAASDMANLAQAYAIKDAPAALAWAERLPESSRAEAAVNAWRLLMQKDQQQATSWMEKNAADPAYRAAVVSHLTHIAGLHPDLARDVAEGIPEETLRAEVLQSIDKVPSRRR